MYKVSQNHMGKRSAFATIATFCNKCFHGNINSMCREGSKMMKPKMMKLEGLLLQQHTAIIDSPRNTTLLRLLGKELHVAMVTALAMRNCSAEQVYLGDDPGYT